MVIDFSNIGREGILNDTKPTINEKQRKELVNNEIAMQIDNSDFYKAVIESKRKADKLSDKIENDFMKKLGSKAKSI